jgi:hypothetical protein
MYGKFTYMEEQHRLQKHLKSAPEAVELLIPPPAIPLLFTE